MEKPKKGEWGIGSEEEKKDIERKKRRIVKGNKEKIEKRRKNRKE